MIVYMAYCGKTNSFYYGKTTKTLHTRRRLHWNEAESGRGQSWFHKAIRKHGKDAFTWHIIEHCDSISELNAAEVRWIALSRECGHRLYNLTKGGDGGARINQKPHVPTIDQRRRISESLRRHYKHNPGTMTGRVGPKSPMYGRSHSEESRAKISLANRGKPKPSNRGAGNGSSRSVVCLTTGEVFPVASDAAKKYGLDLSSLIKCCRGKKRSHGGMRWKYSEDVE